jgi:hypothetical protein
VQQLGQRFDAGRAARRALIYFGLACSDRVGIRTATCKPAFRALRLRQQSVDLIG